MRIWKWTINMNRPSELEVPAGTVFCHVALQPAPGGPQLCVWGDVPDPEALRTTRRLVPLATGEEYDELGCEMHYLGLVQGIGPGGMPVVTHVLEQCEVAS